MMTTINYIIPHQKPLAYLRTISSKLFIPFTESFISKASHLLFRTVLEHKP